MHSQVMHNQVMHSQVKFFFFVPLQSLEKNQPTSADAGNNERVPKGTEYFVPKLEVSTCHTKVDWEKVA
jgi:hypothetical protein